MKFMLICYDDEQAWESLGEAAHKQAMQQAIDLTHELAAKGQYILAAPLQSASTATQVRVRDGKRLITDGPYTEAREVLGGFYVIDVASREEAIAIAARHPGMRFGGVEVRPIVQLEGLPAADKGNP